MSNSTYESLKKVWNHLSKRRHRQFQYLVILTLLSSIAEIVSLGSILPFIAAITSPDDVLNYPLVSFLANYLDIKNGNDLVIPLSITFALAAFLSGAFRLLVLWGTVRLGNGCGADLSVNIFSKTLHQPYEVHIARSSSEIVSGITQKIGAVTGVLISVVTFFTSLGLFLTIMITLIVYNPIVALIASCTFGTLYLLIGFSTSKRLLKNSSIIALQQNHVIKAIQEALGSIRDVLLDGTQNVYIKNYRDSVDKLRRSNVENSFISQFPRYAMESFALILVAILVVILYATYEDMSGTLPLLGMVALGAQRVLPLIQQIYGNWSVLVSSHKALVDVLILLEQSLPLEDSYKITNKLAFTKSICFKNVGFRYSDNSPLIFEDLNLNISKGSRIGLIGKTGCGKSTLVDLLLGLLQPKTGHIFIDGQTISSHQNLAAWQKKLAHVPQSIFLTDESISQNIAFGVPFEEIDIARVKLAAEQAQLSSFIENWNEGYDAIVGERGVRLSGGQKQRIGIARALYKYAEVLIFDEATSALDNETEKDIMKTIDALSRDLTMIIIAHRLTTLKNCDTIIKLHDGMIKQYSYDEIINA